MEASEFTNEPKLCQSCIERGFKPAQIATREWQTGLFYCEECFKALLDNLTNIPQAEGADVRSELPTINDKSKGPVLDYLYQLYKLSLIHISEPTRLLSISYAVFCLKKKKKI